MASIVAAHAAFRTALRAAADAVPANRPFVSRSLRALAYSDVSKVAPGGLKGRGGLPSIAEAAETIAAELEGEGLPEVAAIIRASLA
jgi:hypothetical protein